MTALAYLLLGTVAGLAWFGALRWVGERLTGGASSTRALACLAAVQALRMLGLAALLVACARQGAVPLCMAALGVVLIGSGWAAATRHRLRSSP